MIAARRYLRAGMSAVIALCACAFVGCGFCSNCAVPAFHATPTPVPCLATALSGPPPVTLPASGGFVVLASSAINNSGASIVNGDIGISPGTSVTGFPPGTVNGQVHNNDTAAAQAQADLTNSYNDAAARGGATAVSGDIGGQKLTPGVYKSTSSLQISSGDLTLDGLGNSASVYIFQIGSTLSVSSHRQINLIDGARPCKVFWQVGGSATIGSMVFFNGSILSNGSITIGANTTVHGRALSRNGSVTLDTDAVSRP